MHSLRLPSRGFRSNGAIFANRSPLVTESVILNADSRGRIASTPSSACYSGGFPVRIRRAQVAVFDLHLVLSPHQQMSNSRLSLQLCEGQARHFRPGDIVRFSLTLAVDEAEYKSLSLELRGRSEVRIQQAKDAVSRSWLSRGFSDAPSCRKAICAKPTGRNSAPRPASKLQRARPTETDTSSSARRCSSSHGTSRTAKSPRRNGTTQRSPP